VTAPALISAEYLVDSLGMLCAQPSSANRSHELEQTAEVVQLLMERCGLQTRLVATGGAPVVLGFHGGRQPVTLLLYHHYDTATPGPWRDWHHDPHVLAERGGALYARGVAAGKGPLAAHLSALAALLDIDETLPCNVVVIAEGEGLIGSPHLPDALQVYPDIVAAHACLASAGERDSAGVPYCYAGSKGQLRVRLKARGADLVLPAGLAATVPNALWRLVWAVSAIKGEDEDIKIAGFYDSVEGPPRELNRAIRTMMLDEISRLREWSLPQFLFGMGGSALVRAEVTLPTCNLSSISVESVPAGAGIPPAASALLDFQLVPRQEPALIAALLQEHLLSKGFTDVACELLPGGYAAASTPVENEFFAKLRGVGQEVYAAPLPLLPLGPFALPLSLFQRGLGIPVASVGLQRADSRPHAANERIALDDLIRHGQLLIELLWA